MSDVDLTVVVNVGDDELVHGLHVSPDIDTVIYTLAGMEGPEGWGRSGDTFRVNEELGRFGIDNRFRLGDLDLALNLYRTNRLATGVTLSVVTAEVARAFDLTARILPATDDQVRTMVETPDGLLAFQDYFVLRQTRDEVTGLRFEGAEEASPAPGVIEAIRSADLVVLAPSNPPLSIWPILAIPGVRAAVVDHPKVVAVSPLIGGKALKGPADRVMATLGLSPGNAGVVEAYEGLIDALVIDHTDAAEQPTSVRVVVTDTRIKESAAAERLAGEIIRL